jgi:hypothetical protein
MHLMPNQQDSWGNISSGMQSLDPSSQPQPSTLPSSHLDRFFRDEPLLWHTLKGPDYYDSLVACAAGEVALPFKHWLRIMLHIPSTLSIHELMRIFDEEDTVTVLSTV